MALFIRYLRKEHLSAPDHAVEQIYCRGLSDTVAPGSRDAFAALDESKISRFQYKIMFVSGMGFFTDAYDLFVIGIVVVLIETQWKLSTSQVSWLNSATLLASAFGAIVFGRVADILGRKKIYGYEVLILALGAIASAFAPNYTFLLISRIVLGIGIGGDYPVSATIMSEYSSKSTRGRMVGLVFSMQGAGLVVGPLIASILLGSGASNNLTWRLLLGLGAIPGLAVSTCAARSTRRHGSPRPAAPATKPRRLSRMPPGRGQGPPPGANRPRGTSRASPRAT